jgi:hypothetical protein
MTITTTATGHSYRVVPSGIDREDFPVKIERRVPGGSDWVFVRFCESERKATAIIRDTEATAAAINRVPEKRRTTRS